MNSELVVLSRDVGWIVEIRMRVVVQMGMRDVEEGKEPYRERMGLVLG